MINISPRLYHITQHTRYGYVLAFETLPSATLCMLETLAESQSREAVDANF